MQDFAIFFAERAILELGIGNRFSILRAFFSVLDPVEALWMLYHDIEPNVGLDLRKNVSVRAGRDALDGSLHFREWLEKVDNDHNGALDMISDAIGLDKAKDDQNGAPDAITAKIGLH